MTLGQRVKAARIKADFSLKEAAKILGRGVSTLVNIETDKPVSDRTRARAEVFLKELGNIRNKT